MRCAAQNDAGRAGNMVNNLSRLPCLLCCVVWTAKRSFAGGNLSFTLRMVNETRAWWELCFYLMLMTFSMRMDLWF